ncbi:MAG TPA: PEP/pyruvate-binding domain-containing protein [Thermomicrobiales bacterium]|nr:PEP/pyruvate-binding domain-containing protein [Thermomicrobiales bacterium]
MTFRKTNELVWLNAIHPPLDLVGGKGASLARLTALGAPTPPAVCITTSAYRGVVRELGPAERDPDAAAFYRERIESMPLSQRTTATIWAAYAAIMDRVGRDVPLAVRSSAPSEDSVAYSFAGLHDTILDVRDLVTLESAVKTCWASVWSERAVAYRESAALQDEPSIAVVIQQMVQTDVSLVAFSADPISGDRDRVLINATYGLGEALVSGIVTPDQIAVDRDGIVREYQIGEKARMVIPGDTGTRIVDVPRSLRSVPVLTDAQAAAVATTARELEQRLGYPVDIEAGFAGGEFFLFQARPITTLVPSDAGRVLVTSA